MPNISRRHKPRTSSGKAIGKSIIVLTRLFPQKLNRDKLKPIGMENNMTKKVDMLLVHRDNLSENCISSLHKFFQTSDMDGTKNKEPIAESSTMVIKSERIIRSV